MKSETPPTDITLALNELSKGKVDRADQLMPLVYDELRALASSLLRKESVGNTLQPTALVNEAYLKLINQTRVDWKGKSHFFAIGATIMRRILVDHARSKRRIKRGAGLRREPLNDVAELTIRDNADVLAVDEALQKLEKVDAQQAKIVEMRFFGGLTVAEVAEVLGVSKRKVEYEWEMIRAWLRRELSDEDSE